MWGDGTLILKVTMPASPSGFSGTVELCHTSESTIMNPDPLWDLCGRRHRNRYVMWVNGVGGM